MTGRPHARRTLATSSARVVFPEAVRPSTATRSGCAATQLPMLSAIAARTCPRGSPSAMRGEEHGGEGAAMSSGCSCDRVRSAMGCPLDPRLLGVFVVTGLALNVTPGPDMLFVLAAGANRGRAGGLRAALGISAGSCIHTLAAAGGLSAVLASSSVAFGVTKLVGAAYLVWLGLRSILSREWSRAGEGRGNLGAMARSIRHERVFARAMLTNVLNPKVALFFLALVPQFVSPERGHVALQFLLLGCVFNATGTLVNATVGIFAGEIGRRIADSPRWKRLIDGVTATIFIGLGFRLAIAQRR